MWSRKGGWECFFQVLNLGGLMHIVKGLDLFRQFGIKQWLLMFGKPKLRVHIVMVGRNSSYISSRNVKTHSKGWELLPIFL
jgi:hypothetical protein